MVLGISHGPLVYVNVNLNTSAPPVLFIDDFELVRKPPDALSIVRVRGNRIKKDLVLLTRAATRRGFTIRL